MKIVLVFEKPSAARIVAPFAREHWPADDLLAISANPYSNIRFEYPRHVAWGNYPFLSEPVYQLAPWKEWLPRRIEGSGKLVATTIDETAFLGADQIICACDVDPTGQVAFATLAAKLFSKPATDFAALWLTDFSNAAMAKSIARIEPRAAERGKLIDYGLTKRYFDWNWNVNALGVLGRAMRDAGVPATAPALSKYGLQFLYWLQDQPAPVSTGTAIAAMAHWRGTGRYPFVANQTASLGSTASYLTIINNLIAAGLVNSRGDKPPLEESLEVSPSLSPRGAELLTRLHPDCRDLDLPFRLDAWCAAGSVNSRAAIDRYLKTFFGKQKRYAPHELAC